MAFVEPPSFGITEVAAPPDGPAPPVGSTRPARALGRLGPIAVLVACGVFFTFPLIAMARFSLQNVPMVRLGWSTLFDNWSFSGITKAFDEPEFRSSLALSLKLAVGTVFMTLALLLPTTLWVHLRIPKARSFVEFLTVLPYVIPPIALVAGILPLKPHARWFLNSDYSLIPFYTVLALPFTFRALDAGVRAIDVKTLVDASRSLGAGWGTTLRRALIPNLRTAIISSSFLTAAVVLGEFTVSRVLLKQTFPQFMLVFQQSEPQGGIGLGLLALVATTMLFALLTLLTRKRGAARALAGPTTF
jgi:putative spermidine/putrescine transport system permease protein